MTSLLNQLNTVNFSFPVVPEVDAEELPVIDYRGLKIKVENPSGSAREGVGKDGKPWHTDMHAHYGFIEKTEGSDGDEVDVYLNPMAVSSKVGRDWIDKDVFIVHQIDPDTGKFDEDKVMLGFHNYDQACEVYDMHYDNIDFRGSVTVMPFDRFKESVTGKNKARFQWKKKSKPGPQIGVEFNSNEIRGTNNVMAGAFLDLDIGSWYSNGVDVEVAPSSDVPAKSRAKAPAQPPSIARAPSNIRCPGCGKSYDEPIPFGACGMCFSLTDVNIPSEKNPTKTYPGSPPADTEKYMMQQFENVTNYIATWDKDKHPRGKSGQFIGDNGEGRIKPKIKQQSKPEGRSFKDMKAQHRRIHQQWKKTTNPVESKVLQAALNKLNIAMIRQDRKEKREAMERRRKK